MEGLEEEEEEEIAKQFRVKARTELLRILKDLPVRDEAEILQTAQALSYATAKDDELSLTSVDLSVKILKSISESAQEVYNHDLTPTGSLIPLAVRSTACILKATVAMGQDRDKALAVVYKRLVSESVAAVESLVLNELKYHVISEEPISSTTDYFSVLAARHSAYKDTTLQIHDVSFQLPENLGHVLNSKAGSETNEKCFQSHMTTFKRNPYSFKESEKVNSLVSGLTLYNCHGAELAVDNLPKGRQISVELPNTAPQAPPETHKLERWAMSLHQFNMSVSHLNLSLHLVVELVPVTKGRLFPVTVLISWSQKVSPESYQFKYNFDPGQDYIDLFFPPGSFNVTGTYSICLVDSTYNAGRTRPGEVTQRDYTLKLWWDECLYWNMDREGWVGDGCQISQDSTYRVTKCECNHLTVFGGRLQLIPNQLKLLDVDLFFSLHANPITVTMVSIVVSLYILMLLWCRHGDLHDAKKGGIVYLLDNTAADQQKYEITVETGIRKGAGTTAKISMILHGEEGMSETRELISEDDRPMFERNSTDKFILTLPESIGRIWKLQIWHNNFGESPSWYLSRVVVRDLNTGSHYLFQCDKWLAVEEQDGKVEREFMVQETTLGFTKVFMTKLVQYMADLHLWLSLVTCPPYSGFVRMERLTVCLTTGMLHMGLLAVWYQHIVTEYRGEFSLLDVSWGSVVVGAMCCVLVVPVSIALEVLFRRSKPKHASSCHYKDEGSQWDIVYPSGKPNEQESEDNSEHVPPVMTYSLLDQSILNWPNIQTWAQKQWMKRQQSVRSHNDNHRGSSEHSETSMTQPLMPKPVTPVELALSGQGFSEMDQASSGFEDCSSLIRPKASVDSTHTTAAPSVAESMRTHKPLSPPDSLCGSKQGSVSDSVKTTKAPSISSSASNNPSVLGKRQMCFLSHVYLPYWCRYVAWSLCIIVCVGCVAMTVILGLRFGMRKSTLWLQSLYFSTLLCVFVAYPLQVLLAVVYSSLCYLRDPSTIDTYGYDLFNREKAKEDLRNWKKQMELLEEGDALERGVAARQRSRYLRFARPPQEKQLIEARKRVMKEKKAMSIFRESIAFVATIWLLFVVAYGKDTVPCFLLNTAVKNQFANSGSPRFTAIQTREEWYSWFQASLLPAIERLPRLEDKVGGSVGTSSNYIIGNVQLRQQRVAMQNCKTSLPYATMKCVGDEVTEDNQAFSDLEGVTYMRGHHGNFMIGKNGIYDASGYVLSLNQSSSEASMQIDDLRTKSWLDRRTHAVFVEFTLYNAPTHLFTAVDLLLEMAPTGATLPGVKVTSTHLFRYVTAWDHLVLMCEMLFFLVMLYTCKSQLARILDMKKAYFTLPWNVLNFVICVLSVFYCCCYVYRYLIVSSTLESLRSTYYEKYVDLSFITFWDEMLRSVVSILLFLAFLRCLRLLRYNKQFAIFGDVYRRARREVITLFALFVCVTAAYSSLGHALFGCVQSAFRDPLASLTAVVALILGSRPQPPSIEDRTSSGIFLFTFCIFGIGFLTVYMVAVLTHYFRARRKRRLLAMGSWEAVQFYLRQLQFWAGLRQHPQQHEEEIIVLPPEFTMAEIEYQVDELLFRMNALTGSHGLPEKPPCYMTDSDCTYGGGDDGISSGGSEACQLYGEDRLEQRVQKIEDNLCSQEPFLAQLLKLDNVPTDDWSHEKEKQLRSHLELEIFRQLQIQRQDLKSPSTEQPTTTKAESPDNTNHGDHKAVHSTIHDSTSSDDSGHKAEEKSAKLAQTSLASQILQDLIVKSSPDRKDSHNDNSSSNPDSPLDKLTFTRMKKNNEGILKPKPKANSSSTSSSEKISPDLSLNHAFLAETEGLKKPTKPTFLHSRESSLSEASKGSPSLKVHVDKGVKSDTHLGGIERMLESSSGSEQDGIRVGRKMPGKRSLRKTKSRGKGKGVDSLEPALILDEIEGEEGEGVKVEINVEQQEETSAVKDGKEYTIQADVHVDLAGKV